MKSLIIGAGPAGLTAAYELNQQGLKSIILEADDVVGGISRTINHQGYRFDVGGHRFFTKNALVNDLWQEMLGDDFLVRPRMSRIYYNKHFYDYPLKAVNTLRGLGVIETVRIGLSYIKTRIAPSRPETTFEQWVSNRFGWRLYEIFFKTYTEKVWGIPCNEISAQWATQRIKNLSLVEILRNLVYAKGCGKDGEVITTLIEQFHYPRFGPGMMWERFASHLQEQHIPTLFDQRVETITHQHGRIERVSVRNRLGEETTYEADQFLSSMPLRELVKALKPAPPSEVLKAADGLRYRDFITVVLIVDQEAVFPDNWIYIHSSHIKMGRIQNYKNWSPDMVPDPSRTSLGLEYFVSEHEDLWSWPDQKLIDLGIQECAELGFVQPDAIVEGTVFRMEKAYPVYDQERDGYVAILQDYLSRFENLQAIGRNGQHHYNNMDHSMLTGILAAKNIAGEKHDVWSVNVESEYHEEMGTHAKKALCQDKEAPGAEEERVFADMLKVALARLDPISLGGAIGIVSGLGVFVATALLLLKGGDVVGPRLQLLRYFLIGYRVSWGGACIGLVDASILGFVIGLTLAWLHNICIEAYVVLSQWRVELKQGRDLL
jgi:protoporphyrinogen oxidase